MKQGNCIIVHGCPSRNEKSMDSKTRTYDKHWMPWLKRELERKGVKTFLLLMPKPWEPHYKDWRKVLDKLSINEDTTLIGHSCGGGFLVRWLGDSNKKIKKLILVAPAILYDREWKPLEDLLRFEINENLRNHVKEIIFFISDNESKGILKSVEIFHQKLGGKIIELKGKGHFTLEDMGTVKFPELLKEVLNDK